MKKVIYQNLTELQDSVFHPLFNVTSKKRKKERKDEGKRKAERKVGGEEGRKKGRSEGNRSEGRNLFGAWPVIRNMLWLSRSYCRFHVYFTSACVQTSRIILQL